MQHKNRLWGFFAHAGIIVGTMFVVFFVIDRFNPAMEFLTSSISRWLILVLALVAVGNGIFSATLLFQRQQRQEEKRVAQRTPAARAQSYGNPVRERVAYDAPYAAPAVQRGYDAYATAPYAPYLARDAAPPRQSAPARR